MWTMWKNVYWWAQECKKEILFKYVKRKGGGGGNILVNVYGLK